MLSGLGISYFDKSVITGDGISFYGVGSRITIYSVCSLIVIDFFDFEILIESVEDSLFLIVAFLFCMSYFNSCELTLLLFDVGGLSEFLLSAFEIYTLSSNNGFASTHNKINYIFYIFIY